MVKSDKKEYNRAVIKTGYNCNNDCRFCDCRSLRNHEPLSIKEVASKVLLAKKQRYEMVIFSGGEATLREDMIKLVALCNKIGIQCGLQTNGINLSDRAYTERLVKEGLRFVQLTMLSHDRETHNYLTRNNSYDNTLKAISILNDLKVKTLVNCVVTTVNIDHLTQLAEMLVRFSPLTLKVNLLDPIDIEDENKQLVPSLKKAGEAVVQLVNWHQNNSNLPKDFKIEFSGFPLCTVSFYADRSYDLRSKNHADKSEVYEAVFSRSDFLGRMKPDKCNSCRHLENCPGIYEAYQKFNAEEELNPETGPVSNSFSYEPVKELEGFELLKCPAKAGKMTFNEYERKIILLKDNVYTLYRTDSKDFDTDVFKTTKFTHGQIYIDVSGKVFHEDFEHDMIKLEPHDICSDCEKFTDCPAVYYPVESNVFTNAENELRKQIEKLEGKVLDVGGGPILYAEELGKLIESGKIDYHIIEPDPNPSLLEFLEKHKLTSRYFKGMVENYQSDEKQYDWILVLRSHNHLFDLNAAYNKIAGWLKPDGKLLVADNTIYGILRSKEVWKEIRKHKGHDRFEHYNNHTSQEAIPFVTQANLKLLDKQEVTPKGANQWWCLFEKS